MAKTVRDFVKNSLNSYYKNFQVKMGANADPSINNVHNAIRIANDGSIYIHDAGGFNGYNDNVQNASTLQELLKRDSGGGTPGELIAGNALNIETNKIIQIGYIQRNDSARLSDITNITRFHAIDGSDLTKNVYLYKISPEEKDIPQITKTIRIDHLRGVDLYADEQGTIPLGKIIDAANGDGKIIVFSLQNPASDIPSKNDNPAFFKCYCKKYDLADDKKVIYVTSHLYNTSLNNCTFGSDNFNYAQNANIEGVRNYIDENATGSHAEGYYNTIDSKYSHVEGYKTNAKGDYSHAEGNNTEVKGYASHSEGQYTKANAAGSHAEGYETNANGYASHVEGIGTKTRSDYSHAEGIETETSGYYSHSEGKRSISKGESSHSEGYKSESSGEYSHSEGNFTKANAKGSHAEGLGTRTESSGEYSHSEGYSTITYGIASHAEGLNTYANGDYSHAEGHCSHSTGKYSHAEGEISESAGIYSHSEGYHTKAIGSNSHVEGYCTISQSYSSHAEGGSSRLTYKNNQINVKIKKLSLQQENLLKNKISGNNNYQYILSRYGWNNNDTVLNNAHGCTLKYKDYDYLITSTQYVDLTNFKNGFSGDVFTVNFDKLLPKKISNSWTNAIIIYPEKEGGIAAGMYSHTEGYDSSAYGHMSHAEGDTTSAFGNYSHTEGYKTKAIGEASHAEGRLTEASGLYAHAEGYKTEASGEYCAHAEGYLTEASGIYSHAEGYCTEASGKYSHSEGFMTFAKNNTSHAEGIYTESNNIATHTEGYKTYANGKYSHAEGYYTEALGESSRSSGYYTHANGLYSNSEGYKTNALNTASHAEGGQTKASGQYSHAEGFSDLSNSFNVSLNVELVCSANDEYSSYNYSCIKINKDKQYQLPTTFIGSIITNVDPSYIRDGYNNYVTNKTEYIISSYEISDNETEHIILGNVRVSFKDINNRKYNNVYALGGYDGATGTLILYNYNENANGFASHSEGWNTIAGEEASHSEGIYTKANVRASHTEGEWTTAYGEASHAEGGRTESSGEYSHAEGLGTKSKGRGSHAEGYYTEASGEYSHAEGDTTEASGEYGHAEGSYTKAIGNGSHAEGYNTESSGWYSHAEGNLSYSKGNFSHAEGYNTYANGEYSHAEGYGTIASSQYQHVSGKYNIEDKNNKYAYIIGNGTFRNKSNLFAVTWDGNISGSIIEQNATFNSNKLLTSGGVYNSINNAVQNILRPTLTVYIFANQSNIENGTIDENTIWYGADGTEFIYDVQSVFNKLNLTWDDIESERRHAGDIVDCMISLRFKDNHSHEAEKISAEIHYDGAISGPSGYTVKFKFKIYQYYWIFKITAVLENNNGKVRVRGTTEGQFVNAIKSYFANEM